MKTTDVTDRFGYGDVGFDVKFGKPVVAEKAGLKLHTVNVSLGIWEKQPFIERP